MSQEQKSRLLLHPVAVPVRDRCMSKRLRLVDRNDNDSTIHQKQFVLQELP